jgi:hypothetical protein
MEFGAKLCTTSTNPRTKVEGCATSNINQTKQAGMGRKNGRTKQTQM